MFVEQWEQVMHSGQDWPSNTPPGLWEGSLHSWPHILCLAPFPEDRLRLRVALVAFLKMPAVGVRTDIFFADGAVGAAFHYVCCACSVTAAMALMRTAAECGRS